MKSQSERFLEELKGLLEKHHVKIEVNTEYDGRDNYAGRSVELVVPDQDGKFINLEAVDLPELLARVDHFDSPSKPENKKVRYLTEKWGPTNDVHLEVEMGGRMAFIDITSDGLRIVATTADLVEARVLTGNAAEIRFVKQELIAS